MKEIQKGRSRRAIGLALMAALAAACVVTGQAGTAPAQAPNALQILARYELPAGNTTPTDIRWASDDSVFVSRADDGVFEITLKDGKATKRRQVLPDRFELKPFGTFDRLAVSQYELIASSIGFDIAWRPTEKQASGQVDIQTRSFGTFADIDAQGDKLALLGLPHNDLEKFSGEPGVLWVGSMSKDLKDFHSLLQDASGTDPYKSSLFRCYPLDTGSVRFLADGSILAVPGFQPGAYLYGADGRSLKAWTNQELGVDSGCDDGITLEQSRRFIDSPELRRSWYDRHRIVDDILPLPQGPGLLVRWSGRDGNPRWVLKVLQPQGITLYRVPFSGRTPYERLHGDVRQGKIVLLRTLDSFTASAKPETRGEILVAELPVSVAGRAK